MVLTRDTLKPCNILNASMLTKRVAIAIQWVMIMNVTLFRYGFFTQFHLCPR